MLLYTCSDAILLNVALTHQRYWLFGAGGRQSKGKLQETGSLCACMYRLVRGKRNIFEFYVPEEPI